MPHERDSVGAQKDRLVDTLMTGFSMDPRFGADSVSLKSRQFEGCRDFIAAWCYNPHIGLRLFLDPRKGW